jgi:hypothetical protein
MEKINLKNIYRYEKKNDLYNIDISLDSYDDLFDEWVFAPFTKREFDSDLIDFIEQSFMEIPYKSKIDINFYLPAKIRDENIENRIFRTFKNNIKFRLLKFNNERFRFLKSSSIYAIIGFTFIIISNLIENNIKVSLIKDILAQGILIGAWVLTWNLFSTIFFKLRDLNYKIKIYKKLLNSKIYFYNY